VVETFQVAHPDGAWRKQIPGDLLAEAWHALPWGMLVLSAHGRITFYNQKYAQLRGLVPGALLGHPIDRLDRRHRLRELLRTGTVPPEPGVPNEQRMNREAIFPVWDESKNLTGAVVLVIPHVDGSVSSQEGSSPLM
jgi:PAS domain-containing protein